MASAMSKDEYTRFLSEEARTMKVATVRADGRPHLMPVWFVLDGDTIIFMTGEATVKGRNLRRDPRIALCVDEERPPYAYVSIEGTVQLSADLEEMLPWSIRIAGRYMGADRADQYGKRNAVAGELLVRVTPVKVMAIAGVAD